jgi:ribosomal protein S18 acetylase RimI-like enzyme
MQNKTSLQKSETTEEQKSPRRWATSNTIRAVEPNDAAALITMIEAVGMFPPDELAEVGEMLNGYLDGSLGEDQFWLVDDDEGFAGAAYYAPERMTEGTWNLYMLAVHPERQGEGHGAALVRHVEQTLAARGERLLLIETLGSEEFATQRAFYSNLGYEEEARIRDFYIAGGDKVIFRKALAAQVSTADDYSST